VVYLSIPLFATSSICVVGARLFFGRRGVEVSCCMHDENTTINHALSRDHARENASLHAAYFECWSVFPDSKRCLSAEGLVRG
jgi:hypothetical protein